jgi:aminocarboxymuconate-semialdehyde decarboxylase
MDVDLRIAAMDEAGIDLQLVSPNPITLFHSIETQLAIAFTRRQNELLAEVVSTYPDRLLGAAALPMQDIDAAIRELYRAVQQLGLCGAYVGAHVGRELDAAELDDFYEALVELDVPLFIHPAPDGADGGWRDPRLRRFDLDLILGFAHDEGVAALTLLFGGVLERHPRLDVCLSHGGGMLGPTLGRARAATRRHWAPEWLGGDGFDRLLRRLWFDTHVKSDAALQLLTSFASPDRLVYGSNFGGWDASRDLDENRPNAKFADRLNANACRLLRRHTP